MSGHITRILNVPNKVSSNPKANRVNKHACDGNKTYVSGHITRILNVPNKVSSNPKANRVNKHACDGNKTYVSGHITRILNLPIKCPQIQKRTVLINMHSMVIKHMCRDTLPKY